MIVNTDKDRIDPEICVTAINHLFNLVIIDTSAITAIKVEYIRFGAFRI